MKRGTSTQVAPWTAALAALAMLVAGGRYLAPANTAWWQITGVQALACLALAGGVTLTGHRRLARRMRLRESAAEVARHELSDAMLRLLTIMDTVEDGILVTNRRGTVTLANPAARRLFGLPDDGAPPGDFADLVRLVDMRDCEGRPIAQQDSLLARVQRGDTVQNEDVMVYAGASDRHLRVSASPLYHEGGMIAGAVIAATDVTEHKETQLALKAQARTLLQLNRQLERLATRDNLTGVLNHRGFGERLDEGLARASRFGHALSVLVIDVDRFKQINDEYGHPVGDTVLMAIAQRLEENLRAVDAAGRLGGDEFAVLLPETDAAGALALAGRLRSVLRLPVPLAAGVVIPVTVSIGVAEYRRGQLPESLLKAADDALYAAKREGRDGVRGGADTATSAPAI